LAVGAESSKHSHIATKIGDGIEMEIDPMLAAIAIQALAQTLKGWRVSLSVKLTITNLPPKS
jgi:hypothetical protein